MKKYILFFLLILTNTILGQGFNYDEGTTNKSFSIYNLFNLEAQEKAIPDTVDQDVLALLKAFSRERANLEVRKLIINQGDSTRFDYAIPYNYEMNDSLVNGTIFYFSDKYNNLVPLKPVPNFNIKFDSTGKPIADPDSILIKDLVIKDDGSIRTEGAGEGSNGIIIDTAGLRGYSSTLGMTFNLPTDGSAPWFSSGVIKDVIYEIYTSGVIRTSENVGSGDAGLLINNTGLYIVESGQSLVNANFKALTDGSVTAKGTFTLLNGSSGDGSGIDISGNPTFVSLAQDVSDNGSSISNNYSLIIQNSDLINTKVSKTTFNNELSDINNNISNNTSEISQLADDISSRVTYTEYYQRLNGVTDTLTTQQSLIDQNANSITSRVTYTDFDDRLNGISDTLLNQESSITQLSDEISSKVSVTTYDSEISGINTALNTHESEINQNATDITFKVSSTDYTGDKIISKINLTDNSFQIDAKHIIINGETVFGPGYDPSTKEDASGVVSIIDGRVNADYINALGITALGSVTAGSFNLGNGNFQVDADGNLSANNVDLTGNFYSAGTGGAVELVSGNISFYASGASNVSLSNVNGILSTSDQFNANAYQVGGSPGTAGQYLRSDGQYGFVAGNISSADLPVITASKLNSNYAQDNITVSTDLRFYNGTLQYRNKTVTLLNGIATDKATYSTWQNVPNIVN